MTTYTIDPTRLAYVQTRPLGASSHANLDDGLCVMEAVAYVAGEPWSDHPTCACPVIASFMRAWNDGLPSDEERTRLLRPWIVRLVGTKSTKAVEQRRADMALDWFVRVQAPAWLDLTEALSSHASAIRALPPLHSRAACESAQPVLAAAAQSASAAWDAAWAAARDAAWDAARDAAWDAAWDAVKNMDGVGDTYGAAYAAALPACVALFAPTRDTLQRSALELLDAMVAVTPEAL